MTTRRQQFVLELIAAQQPAIVGAAVAQTVAQLQGPAPTPDAPAPPDLRTLSTQLVAVATVAQAAQNGLKDKANATTVQGLSQTLNTMSAAMPALQAEVATKAPAADVSAQKARVDALTTATTGLQSTLTQQAGELATKVSKTGDTVTGPLVVPPATSRQAAPRFEQIFGGVNSPRRTMENLTTGTAELVPLTDTTNQNRRILPVGVVFLLTGSVGLLSSVTVKLGTTSGGAELYSKTYSVLTGLLNKVLPLDLPASATPLPAGQRLYATISGGGQWTVFFDAVFLPTAQ